ncbi:hypothetical protein ACLOJK_020227 [Asimina triloba]
MIYISFFLQTLFVTLPSHLCPATTAVYTPLSISLRHRHYSTSLPPATPVSLSPSPLPSPCHVHPPLLTLLVSSLQHPSSSLLPATPVGVGPLPLYLSPSSSFSSSHSSHLPFLQHPSPSSLPSPSLALSVFCLSTSVVVVVVAVAVVLRLATQNVRDYGFAGLIIVTDESMEEEGFALNLKTSRQFARTQVRFLLADIASVPGYRFVQWLELVRKRTSQYRSSGFPNHPLRQPTMPLRSISCSQERYQRIPWRLSASMSASDFNIRFGSASVTNISIR